RRWSGPAGELPETRSSLPTSVVLGRRRPPAITQGSQIERKKGRAEEKPSRFAPSSDNHQLSVFAVDGGFDPPEIDAAGHRLSMRRFDIPGFLADRAAGIGMMDRSDKIPPDRVNLNRAFRREVAESHPAHFG